MTSRSSTHLRGTAALLCSALVMSVAVPALADDCNGNGVDDCEEIAAGAADTNANGVLDYCEVVQGDLNLDGLVDGADLGSLLSRWGMTAPDGCSAEPTVPAWATLLKGAPDPAVVHCAPLREAIAATGLAWRVSDTATGMEFVLIPPGTYTMGCSAGESSPCWPDESPIHNVTITQPFYLGRYEVTQAQWQAVMGSNPSRFVGHADSPSRPVERVSWETIQGFLTNTGMRLPTEAEWEYAYRAGTATAFHSMPGYANGTNANSELGTIAWYDLNSGSQTHAVGLKAGNGFGLHDMSGNVWEWVKDFYSSSYYSSSPQIDPQGPTSGVLCSLRGGGWFTISSNSRGSRRNFDGCNDAFSFEPGFRAARNP